MIFAYLGIINISQIAYRQSNNQSAIVDVSKQIEDYELLGDRASFEIM